jgi:hypothetical protein
MMPLAARFMVIWCCCCCSMWLISLSAAAWLVLLHSRGRGPGLMDLGDAWAPAAGSKSDDAGGDSRMKLLAKACRES